MNNQMTDLALGLMLSVGRRIPQADKFLRNGDWAVESFTMTRRKLASHILLHEIGHALGYDFVLVLQLLLLAGEIGSHVVELIACWTLVMLATGVWLWWPRRWKLRGASYWTLEVVAKGLLTP